MSRGKGQQRGRGNPIETSSSNQQEQPIKGNEFRGKGGGQGFQEKCFRCNQIGHKSYDCLETDIG